jgi:hypothetical protein
VDAIVLDPRGAVADAAARTAAALGLPPDWLNDRARAFAIGTSSGAVVFSSDALVVRTASPVQLLAMKLSALRDSVDYGDAKALLQSLGGTREEVWSIGPFLTSEMPDWKRQNFDAIWRDAHGHQ